MEKLTTLIFSIAGTVCVMIIAVFVPGAFLRVILGISGLVDTSDVETHKAIMATSSFIMLVVIIIGLVTSFHRFNNKAKGCVCYKK
jgi:uncharacterized membrane protein YozB (DUF420 family)